MELADRLIVAADFDPDTHGGKECVEAKVIELAFALRDSNITIKLNSAVRGNYRLIHKMHGLGLKVFVDLKLNDIPKTMSIDAAMLADYKPDFLTVMCSSGVDGMSAVQERLPETEVLGVTVLTSFDDAVCQKIYHQKILEAVSNLAAIAYNADAGGIIISPQELSLIKENLREEHRFTLNTPGVRPAWSKITNDDQVRVMTPENAIQSGADRIIIGRPIIQACPNDQNLPQSPAEAVEWTLREIEEALV